MHNYILKIILLFSGFVCLIATPRAQVNLVPNGNFEDLVSCPKYINDFSKLKFWKDPKTIKSSDLFSVCVNDMIGSVPVNYGGVQSAHSFNTYTGIATYSNINNWREYIQVELINQLHSNYTYIISFYVNLSDVSQYASDGLGAFFSNDSLLQFSSYFFTDNPQYELIGSLIQDKDSWVKIFGKFVAKGGEQFLTIGNFNNDINTSIVKICDTCRDPFAYYYIDDVFVGLCDNDTLVNKSICARDSVFLQGQFRKTSGVYIDTLNNMYGCDSVRTTNLIVSSFDTINTTLTICQGDSTLIYGKWQNQVGEFKDTLKNSRGCDSIVYKTTLTVLPIYSINNPQEICQGETYQINEHAYNKTGSYKDTLQTLYGCDSVVTTHLIVHSFDTINTTLTICQGDSTLIYGKWQNQVGEFKDTLKNSLGCDSIVYTTALTVLPIYSINNLQEICQGEYYQMNGHTYNKTGNYKDTLQTVLGCDSVIVTTLHVRPTLYTDSLVYLCKGDSIFINGKWVVAPFTYIDTLSNAYGCDSIVSFQLLSDKALPTIYIGNDTTLCQGESLTIDVTQSEGVYTWQDGSTLPFFLINAAGEYSVKVENSCGYDEDTIQVEMKDCECFALVPEAFSPNQDGNNDYLKIFTNCIEDLLFIVYDRWGEKVFETTNPSDAWDGTYKGRLLDSGVFIYYLEATQMHDDVKLVQKGSITLLR